MTDDDAAADQRLSPHSAGQHSAIFQRLQRVPCRAGEVVIKQGDEGDYFYIIVNASAS